MAMTQNNTTIRAVETLFWYEFNNTALLWEALQAKATPDSNKRLAIVGDAALQLALAEDWYTGNTTRGEWSKIASNVGSNAYLDKIGRGLSLEKYIIREVGYESGKIVADAVEAILGAIYLDGGLTKMKEVMDILDLVPKSRRIERQLELEGFVMLDDEDVERPPRKRRKSGPF